MAENSKSTGRKPANPQIKKNPICLKLEQYLIDWLDAQTESRAVLIARALLKTYNIKEPKP